MQTSADLLLDTSAAIALLDEAHPETAISGGAVSDGLVALAARAAGITLLSRDARAATTYAALKIDFRLL